MKKQKEANDKKPTIATWDAVAERYVLETTDAEREIAREIDELLTSLRVKKGTNLIELGCGSGHISGELAKRGYTTTLLDFSPKALEKAREYYDHEHLTGTFIRADLMKLQKIDVQHAVLWNSGVMEHFDDEHLIKAFSSIRSQLIDELCIFLMPNQHSLPYRMMRFERMSENTWDYGTEYLRDNYTQMLEASGFQVVKETYLGKRFAEHFFHLTNTSPHWRAVFAQMLEHDLIPNDQYYLHAFVAQPTAIPKKKWKLSAVADTTMQFDRAAKISKLPEQQTWKRYFKKIKALILGK